LIEPLFDTFHRWCAKKKWQYSYQPWDLGRNETTEFRFCSIFMIPRTENRVSVKNSARNMVVNTSTQSWSGRLVEWLRRCPEITIVKAAIVKAVSWNHYC
jgi:hypothetical protein